MQRFSLLCLGMMVWGPLGLANEQTQSRYFFSALINRQLPLIAGRKFPNQSLPTMATFLVHRLRKPLLARPISHEGSLFDCSTRLFVVKGEQPVAQKESGSPIEADRALFAEASKLKANHAWQW